MQPKTFMWFNLLGTGTNEKLHVSKVCLDNTPLVSTTVVDLECDKC